jgi:hypothetical protein
LRESCDQRRRGLRSRNPRVTVTPMRSMRATTSTCLGRRTRDGGI